VQSSKPDLEDAGADTSPSGYRATSVYWLVAPVTVIMLAALVTPLIVMLGLTFMKATIFGIDLTPTLANYEKLLGEGIYFALLFKSVRIATVVTAIILLISYPVAYWLAKVVTRRKTLYLLLIFAPYWVNYVIRTYAWMPLLGKAGVLNSTLLALGIFNEPSTAFLFNEFAVHLVLVYVFLPFGIVPLYLSLDRIDPNLLRASADLGAQPWETFTHVILPLSAPGLTGSAISVFVLTVGSYVTPKLVGGASGTMFGNLVADQFGVSVNWSMGTTLALLLAAVSLAIVWLVSRRVPLTQVFVRS
jgi:spermidine/putrescine transport system permease protein